MLPWRKVQNIWLVIVSLFFYAWGEPRVVLIMLLSILMNYLFGILVDRKSEDRKAAKAILIIMLLCNLMVLFVFKYLNFTSQILGGHIWPFQISLPIGISFYTFQAISYVIDVYRGNGKAQKNPLNVALYIAFFPQLIAGPIVRYQTIAEQIENRKETMDGFTEGVRRFIIGLGKKVILANSFAPIADYAFAHISELSGISAWIGAVFYTLQIYYDFSGYSDMAIGLGKMFGFEFLENFNYPYISKSITEFWRRWHISLGSWFRDYVYIPLGGSRVKRKGRLIFNLFVVWSLTGVWHGANWTFIVWGFGYFFILTLEKFLEIPQRMGKRYITKIGYCLFTILCVIFGWVLFRADSLQVAASYIRVMLFQGVTPLDSLAVFLLKDSFLLVLIGILFSTPIVKNVIMKLKQGRVKRYVDFLGVFGYLALLGICISYSINSSYNPFIYFNF